MGKIEFDRKGFTHHPDTPQADKEVYLEHRSKVQKLMQIGLDFILEDGVLYYRSEEPGREEFGANSKFLHRGAYCPSPVLDLLITNVKRGKILVRPSSRSKITHRFRYAQDGRLLYVDNFSDEKMVSSEYLQHAGEALYGITIGMSGRLLCVSEERYEKDCLVSYTLAHFWGENENLTCDKVSCERYEYNDEGLEFWDYYQLDYGVERIAPSGYVSHIRYQFEQENGMLARYRIINHPNVDSGAVFEIASKRSV